MIGKTILHYKILEKLGEGGMGEVFKAQDTKLDRFVALKFLPSQLTASEDDKARFIQEAKAASAMNHPNVCTIYSIEEYEKQLFIAMEFVEGKTLKDKKDSLSEKQILEIGIQVAEGLAAAHEKGIVHRDIKPENIMVRKDGIAQIMDFGLAKLYSESNVSRLTKAGTTMGTMGYMSPEQVQGLDVDHRTDIFSLGVVLYEMFAGESPFKGMHETAIMYEIVNVEAPPISTIKEGIDPQLDEIILECLEKDKDERCQSAKELAKDLRKIKKSSGHRKSRVYQAKSFEKRAAVSKNISVNYYLLVKEHISRNKVSTALISLLAILVIFLVLLKVSSVPGSNHNLPVHFSFNIPAESNPILNWENVFNISTDGKYIAYVDNSKPVNEIYIRSINNTVPTFIRGTEGGTSPFFSKDNNWLTFTLNSFAAKVPVNGGVPDISRYKYGQSANWTSGGKIVSAIDWGGGLYIQNDWESKPEILTTVDVDKNEGTHLHPYVLPGNKAAIFTSWNKDGTFDDSKIGIINLETKERSYLSYKEVNIRGTYPQFFQTSYGDYMTWSRNGNLYASLFDLSGLKIIGTEIKILEKLAVNASSGRAAYSISNANNGTLVYVSGNMETAKNNLVWQTIDGKETNILKESAPITHPCISNDGKLIVTITGPAYKIGQVNFNTGTIEPLFMKGDNDKIQISPDGSSYIFVSNFETGKYNIYHRRIDEVGGSKKIVNLESGTIPRISNLSLDGKIILFSINSPAYLGNDIWIADVNTGKEPEPLFKTPSAEIEPQFSPDGKFIVYRSNEIEGKFKIFIRPFPINENKVQISINDGIYPNWSKDGSKIYYREDDNIMEATIQYSPKLKVLQRKAIFKVKSGLLDASEPDFTVARDGRFIFIKSATDITTPTKVNVITDWFVELKDKLNK